MVDEAEASPNLHEESSLQVKVDKLLPPPPDELEQNLTEITEKVEQMAKKARNMVLKSIDKASEILNLKLKSVQDQYDALHDLNAL